MPKTKIHWGQNATELAAILHREIAAYRKDTGILAPVQIISPHRAMRSWLTLELAALGGGCAHLRFRPMEFLCAPETPRILTITAALFDVLDDETLLQQPHFASPRNFIQREEQTDLRILRRHTLAERVARIFLKYQAHWPEGLRNWELGQENEPERWQAELWRLLQTRIENAGTEIPTQAALDSIARAGPIFVFDAPVPGQDVLAAIRKLPQATALLLRYGAPEYGRGSTLRDFANSENDRTQMPPRQDAWHRHGSLRSQGNRLWLQGVHRDDSNDSVAEKVHTQIASKLPALEILPAPSIRRACETLVSQIWAWVRDDAHNPPLRFHEIAIVIPRTLQDAYLPPLREVMKEGQGLPKVLWNQPIGKSHRMASLARLLLELPTTGLRRDDMLTILRHPLYHEWFGDELPTSFSEWLDAVGIFQGLDQEDLQSTYLLDAPGFHWDQGLSRLALGAFMESERSGAPSIFEAPKGPLEVEERNPSAHQELSRLMGMTRSLLSDAATLRDTWLPAGAWTELLLGYLDTYLPRRVGLSDDDVRGSIRALTRNIEQSGLVGRLPYVLVKSMMLQGLDALPAEIGGKLTSGVVIASPQDVQGIPFRRLVFLGLDAASFPAGGRDAELDLRPKIPGEFLDCRVDNRRAQDALAFYEFIQDAGEGVSLVYVATDPMTGDERHPSLLLEDLKTHAKSLGREISVRRVPQRRDAYWHLPWPPEGDASPRGDVETLPDGALKTEQPGEAEALSWAFPEAKREAACRAWAEAYRKKHGVSPSLAEAEDRWAATLGKAPLRVDALAEDDVVRVSLDNLALFLQCPVQGYARHHLRMRGESEDRSALGEEPFENSRRTRAQVHRGVLAKILSGLPPVNWLEGKVGNEYLTHAYDEVTAAFGRRGELPRGFLGDVQRRKNLRELEETLQKMAAALEKGFEGLAAMPTASRVHWGLSPGRVRLVAGATDTFVDAVERRIWLQGREVRVQVTGTSPFLWSDGAYSLSLASRLRSKDATKDWKPAVQQRELLHAWLSHLLRCSQDGPVRTPKAATQLWTFGLDHVSHGREVRVISRERASQLLDGLLQALVTEKPAYRSPSVVFFRRGEDFGAHVSWVERVRQFLADCEYVYGGETPVEQTTYAVIRGIAALPVPAEADFERIYQRTTWLRQAFAGESLELSGEAA